MLILLEVALRRKLLDNLLEAFLWGERQVRDAISRERRRNAP